MDPAIVKKMAAAADRRSRDAIRDKFGISDNTWRKILAGDAIRTSVASRLLSRLDQIVGSEAIG